MSNNTPPPDTRSRSSSARLRSFFLQAVWLLALLGIVGGMCLVFTIPWVKLPSFSTMTLAQYLPLADGDACLLTSYDSSGQAALFASQNVKSVPAKILVDSLVQPGTYSILQKFVLGRVTYEMEDISVVLKLSRQLIAEINSRYLLLDGTVQETRRLVIRTRKGDFLLKETLIDGSDIVYDPPIMLLPPRMEPGNDWAGESTASTGQRLKYRGEISAVETFSTRGGREFSDCLLVDFYHQVDGGNDGSLHYTQWYCAGVGLVSVEYFDDRGEVLSHSEISGSTYPLPPLSAQDDGLSSIPSIPLLPDGGVFGQLFKPESKNWKLIEVKLAEYDPYSSVMENSIYPLWVQTDPPMLLYARINGDINALHADPLEPDLFWQYHSGGVVFGRPVFDAARGRIYFGTSSKRLIALDARGLFLWSFETGDNIASQPVVVNDVLVFGSEDRSIYALNVDTGGLLWQVRTGGPVASSPVVAGGQVIIGSDDGTVYALDAATGEEVWTYATKDAVEAPLIVDQGALYAASSDTYLYALQAETGEEIWKAEADNALRTIPVISEDVIYVVDELGWLSAFERKNGRHLWTFEQADVQAPIMVLEDRLLAAGLSGQIHQISFDGLEIAPAVIARSQTESVSLSDFYFGIVEGGGAGWLADFQGRIWRYGPLDR